MHKHCDYGIYIAHLYRQIECNLKLTLLVIISVLRSSLVIPVQPSVLSALAVWSLQEFLFQSLQVKNYLIWEENIFLIPKKMIRWYIIFGHNIWILFHFIWQTCKDFSIVYIILFLILVWQSSKNMFIILIQSYPQQAPEKLLEHSAQDAQETLTFVRLMYLGVNMSTLQCFQVRKSINLHFKIWFNFILINFNLIIGGFWI